MEGEFGDPGPLPLPMPPGVVGDALPFAPTESPTITQVSWFGYDATLDGDDIVVVVDEERTQPFAIMYGGVDVRGLPEGGGAGVPASGDFTPADPPPLAPGLTGTVPPPDLEHRHQLKLMRLD